MARKQIAELQITKTSVWKEKLKNITIGRLWVDSKIPNSGMGQNFENFRVTKNNKFAFYKISDFVKSLGENREFHKGIFLYGPTGVGKTHLAFAAANKLILNFSLFVRFLPTYLIPRHDTTAVLDLTDMGKNPVLILDDIGAEKLTERALECLFMIIDLRLQNDCPMIITSNFSPDDLESRLDLGMPGYGKRIVSRLFEACDFLPIGGKDYRKEDLN